MNSSLFCQRIDNIIRFLLYGVIFWIPYSPAIVETCIVFSIFLWILKRFILFFSSGLKKKDGREKLSLLFKSFKVQHTYLNGAIGYFILACGFSLLATWFFPQAIRGFFYKTLEWFVVYFLVVEVFQKPKHVFVALGVLSFTAFSSCLDALYQYHFSGKDIFFGHSLNGGGATAGFKHYNNFGGFLTFVVPLFFSLVLIYRQSRYFFLAVLMFALSLWAAVITLSRGTWVGIFIGTLMFLFILDKKKILYVCLGVFFGMVALYLFSNTDTQEKLRIDFHNVQGTFLGRAELWKESRAMIKDRPLFGHGPNMFMGVFQAYRLNASEAPTYAHNCYIQIIAELGFVGLGCFLWMMFISLKKPFLTLRTAAFNHDRWPYVTLALMSGMLAFLIHSFFDTDFYSLQLSIYFWYMAGLLSISDTLLNKSQARDISLA